MAMRVCSVSGCPELYDQTEGTRCRAHRAAAERRRGSSSKRGYSSAGHQHFRAEVLRRDPICVLCRARESIHADHYPHGRDDLIRLGLNPNDPARGRGLCTVCHSRETASAQPGGWNRR